MVLATTWLDLTKLFYIVLQRYEFVDKYVGIIIKIKHGGKNIIVGSCY